MRAQDLEKLLHALGAQKLRKIKGHYLFSCLLAPWTHKEGTDSYPSMEISFNDQGDSLYHCFACGRSGTLSTFMIEYNSYTKGQHIDLERWVLDLEDDLGIGSISAQVLENFAPKAPPEPPKPLSPERLEEFAGRVPQYILDRGLSLQTCKDWELGYDEVMRRVTFPIRDYKGGLVGLVGRAIAPDVEPRYFNYWNFPKSNYLYGEWKLTSGHNHIILVEGMISTTAVYEYGFRNCVGLMGSKISEDQTRKIRMTNRPIYLAVDMDKEGNHCRAIVYNMLKRNSLAVPVFDVQLPKKDPAECSKEQFIEAMNSAKIWKD